MDQRNRAVAAVAGTTVSLAAVVAVVLMLTTGQTPEAVSTRQSSSPTIAAVGQSIAPPGVPTPWMTTGTDGQLQPATLTTTAPDGTQITATVLATTGTDGMSTPLPVSSGGLATVDPLTGATQTLPALTPVHPGHGTHSDPVHTVTVPSIPPSTTAATTIPAGGNTTTPVITSPAGTTTNGPPKTPAEVTTSVGGPVGPGEQPPASTPGVPLTVFSVLPVEVDAEAFRAAVNATPVGANVRVNLPPATTAEQLVTTTRLLSYAHSQGLRVHLLITSTTSDWEMLASTLGPSVDVWQLLTAADTAETDLGRLASTLSVITTTVHAADRSSQVSLGLTGANLRFTAEVFATSVDALTVPSTTNTTEVGTVSAALKLPIYLAG